MQFSHIVLPEKTGTDKKCRSIDGQGKGCDVTTGSWFYCKCLMSWIQKWTTLIVHWANYTVVPLAGGSVLPDFNFVLFMKAPTLARVDLGHLMAALHASWSLAASLFRPLYPRGHTPWHRPRFISVLPLVTPTLTLTLLIFRTQLPASTLPTHTDHLSLPLLITAGNFGSFVWMKMHSVLE